MIWCCLKDSFKCLELLLCEFHKLPTRPTQPTPVGHIMLEEISYDMTIAASFTRVYLKDMVMIVEILKAYCIVNVSVKFN